MPKLPPNLARALSLDSDEIVVYRDHAVFHPEVSFWHGLGDLILTNHRILWATGALKKSVRLNIPLDDVTHIALNRSWFTGSSVTLGLRKPEPADNHRSPYKFGFSQFDVVCGNAWYLEYDSVGLIDLITLGLSRRLNRSAEFFEHLLALGLPEKKPWAPSRSRGNSD